MRMGIQIFNSPLTRGDQGVCKKGNYFQYKTKRREVKKDEKDIYLVFSMQANAALTNLGTDSLGNPLIYDSDFNITWYDYTKSQDTWDNQMTWASGLTVNFGGTIYDDWRLPSTVDGPYVWGNDGTTTAGYNITSSEMGHLFYTELGNKGYCSTSGYCPQAGWGLKNEGPFTHLDPVGYYWSSTEYAATPSNAWFFNFYTGAQQLGGTGTYYLFLMPFSHIVCTGNANRL